MSPITDQPVEPRLASLQRELERDAAFGQVYAVLTVGATLIATLGLLSNSAGVVIGAMVVAPWILPLQAMAFEILRGRLAGVVRAFLTLMLGVAICLGLSLLLGLLVAFPTFGTEVINRTRPNLLDLGIALVAGGIAMYARLRREAITALAGLAIAVALVPPVCVMGLLLSSHRMDEATGAGLLFTTNLMGILVGAMAVLGTLEPAYRQRLVRSRLGLTSMLLTALLVVPLGGSFLSLVQSSRQEVARQQVEETIRQSLRRQTLTLGKDSQLESVSVDWDQNPYLILAQVRVTDPKLPTPRQVAEVQKFVNTQQQKQNPPRRFRLVVQRISTDVIGPETEPNPPESLPLPPPLPPLPGLRRGEDAPPEPTAPKPPREPQPPPEQEAGGQRWPPLQAPPPATTP
jgi:uncharacterized hydrophobic protein (TIGR00271 family)